MTDRSQTLPQTVSVSPPSEITFQQFSRGSHGIIENNPVIAASKTDFKLLSSGIIMYWEPSAAADGDPHTMNFWPARNLNLDSHRKSWAGSYKPLSDLLRTYSISFPDDVSRGMLSVEHQDECKRAIRQLLSTAGSQSRDGEHANPVEKYSVEAALEIVEELPDSVEPPEISADPEGNIEFDWHLDNGAMFTVSVRQSGDVAISGLFLGKSKLTCMVEDGEGKTFSLLQCGLEWLREMKERK